LEHQHLESDLLTADIGNPPGSTSQHAEEADDDWNLVSLMNSPEVVTDPFHDDGNPEVQVESATTTTEYNEETSEQQVDVPHFFATGLERVHGPQFRQPVFCQQGNERKPLVHLL
jgi:hypothetical protein